MHIALWIAQSILAAAMLAAGMMKLTTDKPTLEKKMRWATLFDAGRIRLIGLVEVLAAVGLVVPPLVGILPILTPIAAAGLVVVMVGAARVHVSLKETPVPPLVLGAIAAFVAVGRFVLVPFV